MASRRNTSTSDPHDTPANVYEEESYIDPREAVYDQDEPASHYSVTPEGASMIDPTDWDLDRVEEPIVLPDGTEVQLRILSVKQGTDKNGLLYWQPTLEIMDEPRCKDFTYFLHCPNRQEMNAKQFHRVSFALKVFMLAFELNYKHSFNPMEDWLGATGWAILSLRDNGQYGMQNGIKRLIQPR